MVPYTGGSSIAWRVAQAYTRRGKPIVVRCVTRLSGRDPFPNPPTLNGAALDGAFPAGATAVEIRGTDASGRLVAGDSFVLAGTAYTVTADVHARQYGVGLPGFSAVPITPPLVADAADRAPLVMIWSAEVTVYARIRGFPRSLANGGEVQLQDLSISIPAYSLPSDPQEQWRLVVDGNDLSVVSKQPVYAGSVIVEWNLQARA